MRRPLNIVLAIIAGMLWAAYVSLAFVHSQIQSQNLMNTLDLPPIGGEPGEFMEYLLNVWVWDGMMLGSLCLASFVTLLWVVRLGLRPPLVRSAFEVIEVPTGCAGRATNPAVRETESGENHVR